MMEEFPLAIADHQQAGELFTASLEQDLPVIKRLAENGANPSILLPLPEANSTLHLLCGHVGNLEVLKVLKSTCGELCDWELRDRDGCTPLHHAVMHGHKDVMLYLVNELKCDPNAQNNKEDTVLHMLCSREWVEDSVVVKFMKYLVSVGNSDVNAVNIFGSTPLMLSSKLNSPAITQCLINDLHCDLLPKDVHGDTALHIACFRKNTEVIRLILLSVTDPDAGSSDVVNAKNKDGLSPLHLASLKVNQPTLPELLTIIKVLVQSKCEVNATTCSGYTPLMILSEWVTWKAIPQYLMSCGCDLSLMNEDGNTALHLACIEENVEFVDVIIKSEGSRYIGVKNKKGYTPLLIACLKNNTKIATILVSASTSYEMFMLLRTSDSLHIFVNMMNEKNPELHRLIKEKINEACDGNGNTLLHIACKFGNVKVVKVIRDYGIRIQCDPNATNNDGDTPLHLACRVDNPQIAEVLLDMKSDVNVQNKDGETPFTSMCRYSSRQCIELFQRRNISSNKGETPFFILCMLGNTVLVKYLLSLKACNTSNPNNDGKGPICAAFSHGQQEIVKLLLTKTPVQFSIADVNYLYNNGLELHRICRDHSISLIHSYCSGPGNLDALKLIAESAFDIQPNMKDDQGLTPLHYACHFGHLEIVKYLVGELMCETSVKNLRSETPLHLACISPAKESLVFEMVKFFVSKSQCDCNAVDIEGYSPLMLLIKMNVTWMSIIQFLILQCKCDLFIRNTRGETALHLACVTGNLEVVQTVLETSFDPTIEDISGNTPLQLACMHKHEDIVKLLLEADVYEWSSLLCVLPLVRGEEKMVFDLVAAMEMKYNDDDGNTFLHYACLKGDVNLVRLILKSSKKNSLNSTNVSGDTPFHLACKSDKSLLVTLLLGAQCSVELQNKAGDTPLHIASKRGNIFAAEMLLAGCKQIDLDVKNMKGTTPLQLAIQNHHLDIAILLFNHDKSAALKLKQLTKEGLDPEIFINSTSVLHNACGLDGDLEAVKLFARPGEGDPDMMDETGWTPLHHACFYCHLEIVEYLVNEVGCNPSAITLKQSTCLQLACDSECQEIEALKIIKFLTANGRCDTSSKLCDGDTLLIYLLRMKKVKLNIMQYLIVECSCDLLAKGRNGDTALHIACSGSTSNIEAIKLIASRGKSFASAKNDANDTPLHMACQSGNPVIVRAFLELFKDECGLCEENNLGLTPLQTTSLSDKNLAREFLSYKDTDGNTLLHLACRSANPQFLKLLLDGKHNVECENKAGDTPLHVACRYGDVATFQMILEKCEFSEPRNISGVTPLQIAIQNNNLEIASLLISCEKSIILKIKQLVKEGFNPNLFLRMEFFNSMSILHIACGPAGDSEVLKMFSRPDDDHYDIEDDAGWTPLHYASFHCHQEIIEYLVNEVGSNPNAVTAEGTTTLQLACNSDCSEEKALKTVRFLIANGKCDPNSKVYNGDTLLNNLLKTRNIKSTIVQYLINEYKCDLHAKCLNGDTALHIACDSSTSNIDVIKLIARRGQGFVVAKNYANDTPLHLACQGENPEIVKAVLELFKGECGLCEENYHGQTPLQTTPLFHHQVVSLISKELLVYEDKDGNTPLHLACRSANCQFLKLLFADKHSLEHQNKAGDTPLHVACRCGDIDTFQMIFEQCEFIEPRNISGVTPLQIAIQNNNLEIATLLLSSEKSVILKAKQLVKEGFNPNLFLRMEFFNSMSILHIACGPAGDLEALKMFAMPDEDHYDIEDDAGWTPLHYASFHCHQEIIEYLVNEVGSNPNAVTVYNETCLELACNSDCTEDRTLKTVRFLIANGKCDPNSEVYKGDTLLIYLLNTRNTKSTILQYLIDEYKCDLHAKCSNGNTALHIACDSLTSNIEVIKLIASRGQGFVSAKNNANNTPLHVASQSGNPEIVKAVLELFKGECGLCEENYLGQTPLQTALSFGKSHHQVVTLISKKLLVYEDKDGNTPLHLACRSGNHQFLELLLDSEHNVECQNVVGDTPLYVACKCGDITTIQIILKFCQPLIVDDVTPLQIAIQSNNLDVASLLLSHEKFVCLKVKHLIKEGFGHNDLLKIKIYNSTTVLHIACGSESDFETVKLLTRLGDPDIMDGNGWTPLHYACLHCQQEIIEYLVNEVESNPSAVTAEGTTVLQLACNTNCSEDRALKAVQFLIASGRCDPNSKVYDGSTLLIYLLKTMNIKSTILRYLIDDYKCDLHAKCSNGDTALHVACDSLTSNMEAIKLIANRGKSFASIKNNANNTPLHVACQSGNFEIVKAVLVLFKGECGLCEENILGQTPLQTAVLFGKSHHEVVTLISTELLVYEDKDGNTPLHLACRSANPTFLKFLLDGEHNLEYKNKAGDTPLHVACKCSDVATFQTILEFSEPSDATLQIVIQNNNLDIANLVISCEKSVISKVKQLVEEGFIPNLFLRMEFFDSMSILHIACGPAGDLEALKMFAGPGNDHYDIEDGRGWTPLHYASFHCHQEIIEYLVNEVGSKPNAFTARNETCLELACNSDCSEDRALKTIQFLITNSKCDPNSEVYNRDTLLIYLLKTRNTKSTILRYLVDEYKCDLHAKCSNGDTALHIACDSQTSNIEVIKLIASRGQGFASAKNKAKNTPLHVACQSGNSDIVKAVLELFKGECGLCEENILDQTPLQTTSKSHHQVVTLISKELLIYVDKNGNTPLHLACRSDNSQFLNLLLDAKHNVEYQNYAGDTPLHVACRCGNKTAIMILQERYKLNGSGPKNDNGVTPLQLAIQNNNIHVARILISGPHEIDQTIITKVKQLVREGADPNQLLKVMFYNSMSAVHIACGHEGDLEAVKLLARPGEGDPNMKDDTFRGWTPLHYACYYCHLEIVEYLVNEVGSNPNELTTNHTTTLELVCNSDCPEDQALGIVKFLIANEKCNPDKELLNGDTLLIYLIKTKRSKLAIMQFLIVEYQCDLDARSPNGNTALHFACDRQTSNLEVIKLIASRGQSFIAAKNDANNTPLHVACQSGNPEIVKAVLELFKGECELCDENKYGQTPLEIAISLGEDCQVITLISNELLVYEDKDGNTPLHLAVMSSNSGFLKLLLYAEHNVECENKSGDTPLSVACRYSDIANFQLKHEFSEPKNIVFASLLLKTPVVLKIKQLVNDGYDLNQLLKITLCESMSQALNVLARQGWNDPETGRWTPLHYACFSCHLEITEYLVNEVGSNPNAVTTDGITPLQLACESYCPENQALNIVKLLIANLKCNPNAMVHDGDTLLIYLLKTKSNKVLFLHYLIIEYGCDLSMKSSSGDTALHIVCDGPTSNIEVIKLIASRGQGFASIKNDTNNTPLHVACKSGNSDIVKAVLELFRGKCGLCETNSLGHTPLQAAVEWNQHSRIILSLISEELLTYSDQDGNTALHIACRSGNLQLVKLLLEAKHDVGCKNKADDTPLHVACTYSNCAAFRESENIDGATPLDLAIQNNKLDIASLLIDHDFLTKSAQVKLLVCKGFNPSQLLKIKFSNSRTLLHFACGHKGDLEAVKLLVKPDEGDPDLKDNMGWTPLHHACFHCHLEIVEYLVNEVGSNPNAFTVDDTTSLQLACDSDCPEDQTLKIVKFLVANRKCDPNAKVHHRDTLLIYLLKNNKSVKFNVIRYLIVEYSCDLLAKSYNGDTALHIACSWPTSNVEVIKMIASRSRNFASAKNYVNSTPLHLACRSGNLDNVKTVLELFKGECGLCEVNCLGRTPIQSALSFGKSHYQVVALISKELMDYEDKDGNTPLHLACRSDNPQFLKLLLDSEHNVTRQNNAGDTPLHVACRCGNKTATVIIQERYNLNESGPKNTDGATPLHLAIQNHNFDVARILISGPHENDQTIITKVKQLVREGIDTSQLLEIMFYDSMSVIHIACGRKGDLEAVKLLARPGEGDPNMKDDTFRGWTPLHYACYYGHLEVVEYLVNEVGSNPNELTANHTTTLQLTCSSDCPEDQALNIVKFLTANGKCDPNEELLNGDTLLIYLIKTKKSKLAIMQYLIVEYQCDLDARSPNGNTALHFACDGPTSNTEVIKMIATRGNSFTSAMNLVNYTPLHVVCQTGKPDRVKTFLQSFRECGLYELNSAEMTPLQTAASLNFNESHLEVVAMIVEEMFMHRGKDRNTPIHLACMSLDSSCLEVIIDSKACCDVNAVNSSGDTALHIACSKDSLLLVELILKLNSIQHQRDVTKLNPNIPNATGETPLQLTSNPPIIHELIRYGAHPSYTLANSVKLRSKHPPQPVVKIFIVGNKCVGKSTLTAALQKEVSPIIKALTPPRKIQRVDERTAGIIPYEFESRKLGQVTLYDFAGHREFYSSHAALLQNSVEFSPPIFLLVVDLRDSYETVKYNILYWLSFLENQCPSVSKKPCIIIVGSHADIVKAQGEKIEDKEAVIQHIKQSSEVTSLELIGFVAMDCQYSQSPGMAKLRHYLKDNCKTLRTLCTESIQFNARCFLEYLYVNFKVSKAITLDQIMIAISNERDSATENSPLFFLPNNLQVLFDLCHDLNDRGHILLLTNKKILTNSWIVLDKEPLLSEVIGTLFAPEGLKRYCNLASNTGVVPLLRLSEKLSSYSPTMLVGFLTHLEFCHEISDKETLQLIGEQLKSTDPSSSRDETYLFFPALVKLEAPSNVWMPKSHFIYYFGWVLKCSKPEQFFTSRFLEVLLLRLTFSFAVVSTTDDASNDSDIPVLQRKCSIWKNGIFWGNTDGIETIVEVLPNNKKVVVLMRSSDKNDVSAFLKLRSHVIQTIISALSDFCAKVSTIEYFIDPADILSYPIKTSVFYSAEDVSTLIAKNSSDSVFAVSDSGALLPLKMLLTFEPYAILGQQALAKIFSTSNASEFVSDYMLANITEVVLTSESSLFYAKLFNRALTTPPTSQQLLHILKSWRESCTGTYQNLHDKLNQYSILIGRNLLVRLSTQCSICMLQ